MVFLGLAAFQELAVGLAKVDIRAIRELVDFREFLVGQANLVTVVGQAKVAHQVFQAIADFLAIAVCKALASISKAKFQLLQVCRLQAIKLMMHILLLKMEIYGYGTALHGLTQDKLLDLPDKVDCQVSVVTQESLGFLGIAAFQDSVVILDIQEYQDGLVNQVIADLVALVDGQVSVDILVIAEFQATVALAAFQVGRALADIAVKAVNQVLAVIQVVV